MSRFVHRDATTNSGSESLRQNRRNAFRNMADRCGVDELNSLASALVAAEQKGSDISYPLRTTSVSDQRAIEAQERRGSCQSSCENGACDHALCYAAHTCAHAWTRDFHYLAADITDHVC